VSIESAAGVEIHRLEEADEQQAQAETVADDAVDVLDIDDAVARETGGFAQSRTDHWARNRPLCSQSKQPDKFNSPHSPML